MFDSWAWWEVLHATPTGERLARKYVQAVDVRVLTVDLALAEISAKLSRDGRMEETARALAAVQAASEIVSISALAAQAAGSLLSELRKVDRGASLADAVMLSVARAEGAVLVSGDPCFRREKDVTSA